MKRKKKGGLEEDAFLCVSISADDSFDISRLLLHSRSLARSRPQELESGMHVSGGSLLANQKKHTKAGAEEHGDAAGAEKKE